MNMHIEAHARTKNFSNTVVLNFLFNFIKPVPVHLDVYYIMQG